MSKSIQVFFIPYGIADISCYKGVIEELKQMSTQEVEWIPIELKGRGTRRKEAAYATIEEGAEDVLEFIRTNRRAEKIYVYGHCVGGIIAYDLYKNHNELFEKVILGSISANRKIFNDFERFAVNNIRENIKLIVGEIDDQLIEQAYLYKRPLLEHEFNLIRDYISKEKIALDERVVLVHGIDDEFYSPSILEKEIANYEKVVKYEVEGNHYFVDSCKQQLAHIICKEIGIAE